MIEAISTLFNLSIEQIQSFFKEITEREIYIYDEDTDGKDTPCKIVTKEQGQFTVYNKLKENFTFFPIDEGLIVSKENRKCDFAIYNSTSFYFVELKNVKTNRRKAAKKEAVKQLEATLLTFFNIDFENRKKHAIIGMKTVKPYIIKASTNTKRAYFKDTYQTYLEEGSLIELRN